MWKKTPNSKYLPGKGEYWSICPMFQIFRKLAVGLISFSPVLEHWWKLVAWSPMRTKESWAVTAVPEDLQWTETHVAWWPLLCGRRKKEEWSVYSMFCVGCLISVSLDSDWRLSPAHSRSFEAPENQSWLVWGSFREPAVLQTDTRGSKRLQTPGNRRPLQTGTVHA